MHDVLDVDGRDFRRSARLWRRPTCLGHVLHEHAGPPRTVFHLHRSIEGPNGSHAREILSSCRRDSEQPYENEAEATGEAVRPGAARLRTRTTSVSLRTEGNLRNASRSLPMTQNPPSCSMRWPPGATLKDYQLEVVAWTVSLWENSISGIFKLG